MSFISLVACGGGSSYIPREVAGAPMQSEMLAYERAGVPPQPRQDYVDPAERYGAIIETVFANAAEAPQSTFSVDVDTAAYSNVRRFLAHGQRPPADAVRVEELINYFDYDYAVPSGEHPIAITSELATSPFHRNRELLRIGLSAHDGAEIDKPKNLVFLIDVSGSMQDDNKLPLLKDALEMLVDQLGERDLISVVVYAGTSGVVLEPTPGNEKEVIRRAIQNLEAGGSTNGGAGIERAYQLAAMHRRPGAIDRVILATDGDFNVGVTTQDALMLLIEQKREQGVSLSVLGFGMGNLNDRAMEQMADWGNGNYAYIDTLLEAQKVLVDEASGTLTTVAKDAKLQLTWDPEQVARYRLIGYENRRLKNEDFANDARDAGDMGDGHRVTALYEIERARGGDDSERPLVKIAVRYKRPGERASQLLVHDVHGAAVDFDDASTDTRFASAVAGFGMLLRDSPHRGELGWSDVLRVAQGALGRDPSGYRHELVDLVTTAKALYED